MRDFTRFGLMNMNMSLDDYNDLSDEEKENLNFVYDCLYNKDELIRTSSIDMMFLVFGVLFSEEMYEYDEEEILEESHRILDNLNEEGKKTIEKFEQCLINTIGLYSKEEIKKRKLEKERNK